MEGVREMNYEPLLFSKEMVDAIRHVSVERRCFHGESRVHFHEFFEIELILGGSGRQMLNGVEYELQRGSVYLLSPADFHNVICDDELDLINIMFDENLLSGEITERILRSQWQYCFDVDEKTLIRAQMLGELLMEDCARDGTFVDTCIRDLMEYLLLFLIRSAGSVTEAIGERSAFSNGALRYLYLHFRENPSVVEIAEACGYTPNYFCKLFRNLTGRSYTDFLNTLKINHAKMLLSSTDLTVTEVAFACGFTSLSNFYRVFRAHTDKIPMALRHGATTDAYRL